MMKKKKDVLFLLQFFYPEYISSATLPFDTASALTSQGFSVDVLCGYPHEYSNSKNVPRKEIVNEIGIQRVKYLQMDRKKTIGRIVNFLSLTAAMFIRLPKMRKYKAVVVYSNPPILPWVATWAKKLFKCKLIFVAYDLYPEIALKTNSLSENGIITKLMRHINKGFFNRTDAVVALSSEMKKYISESRKVSEDKIYIIPNWYKDEFLTEDYQDNSFKSVVEDRFVVGYFGNMGIAQDMNILMEAMRFYKNQEDICFLLSGHGAKHKSIGDMIKSENFKNVYLYDFLKGKDYLDALRISNCAIISLEKGLTGLCVPSKTYGYMMQGLPIVAIMEDSDIARDAADGAGYHISQNSSELLIKAIEEMKNDPLECAKKGEKCRKVYLEKYTPEKCLDKYVRLFKTVLFTKKNLN